MYIPNWYKTDRIDGYKKGEKHKMVTRLKRQLGRKYNLYKKR